MISSIETWIDWLFIGGINQKYLGKNKTSEDAFADYVLVCTLFHYLVGNNFTCAFVPLLFICDWDHEY